VERDSHFEHREAGAEAVSAQGSAFPAINVSGDIVPPNGNLTLISSFYRLALVLSRLICCKELKDCHKCTALA
jgi:hypothetical protein